MDGFFSFDGKFFRIADKVGNLFWLNLICLLCCVPMITIGPSVTACYYVTLRMVRNEEQYIARDFFRSFRRNFRQGILIWLIVTAIFLVLFLGTRLLTVSDFIPLSGLFLILDGVFTILMAMGAVYVFPLLAKFDNSVPSMMKNAFQISFRHVPKTLFILAIHGVGLALLLAALLEENMAWLLSVFLCFGMSGPSFLCSRFLVPIFDQYV